MRYLVVGTLPPPVMGRSAALLAAVNRLEAEGHEVAVLPVGVGDPASRLGGLAAKAGVDVLGALLRRRSRSTALILQVEPGLVGREPGRLRRAAGLTTLALALTGWQSVEIRIDSFTDLPSGLGGRAAATVWSRADRIVVSSEEQAEMLKAAGGGGLADVEIEVEAAETADATLAWPPDSDNPDLQLVQAVLRRRAGAERALSGRRGPDAASAMLAASESPARGPYGPIEPVVRFVYERPALRAPARVVRRALRPGR